jgi:hypothetical protein
MQQTRSLRRCSSASSLIFALVVTSGAVLAGQQQTGVIVQDAPLVLLPEKARSPLLIMEKGVTVQVIRRVGDWFNVTVQGSRWGDRTGYVEAKYLQFRASDPPQSAPGAAAIPVPRVEGPRLNGLPGAPVPVAEPPAAPRAPRPVADVSLKNVRRIFIEPMPGDLDQYISAEITKELKGRVVVVLDKANADAIMRGVGESKNGVGAASITLVDRDETVVLWASDAGDRNLKSGVLARGGQRKVADRLVNNLKKALNEAR